MVAASAALLEKAARLSVKQWADAESAQAEAHRLRLSAEELVEHDLNAYLAYVAAVRSGRDVEAARRRTVEVPLEIVGAAGAVVELAGRLAAHGNPRLRADAVAAAMLAHAAAETAAMLVEVNLADGDDAPARASSARAPRRAAPARRGDRGRAPARSAGSRPR